MAPQQSPWENDKCVSLTIYLCNVRLWYSISKTTPNTKWKKRKTKQNSKSRAIKKEPGTFTGCCWEGRIHFWIGTWQYVSNIHSFKIFISWSIISRTKSWGNKSCAQRYTIYGWMLIYNVILHKEKPRKMYK